MKLTVKNDRKPASITDRANEGSAKELHAKSMPAKTRAMKQATQNAPVRQSRAVADQPAAVTEQALEYDFDESVGYWMVLAAQAYQNALNDELAPHGITFRQCQVLGWLMLEGEMSQVDLASRMMIEAATLAGVLERMERQRWISRKSSSGDRRRKIVQVNPEAREAWKQIVSCARRIRARAVCGLSARQTSALKSALRSVLQNLT